MHYTRKENWTFSESYKLYDDNDGPKSSVLPNGKLQLVGAGYLKTFNFIDIIAV